METQRAVVALTIGPVLLIATYLGGWFYFIPLLALLVVAGSEYARIMHALNHNVPRLSLIHISC